MFLKIVLEPYKQRNIVEFHIILPIFLYGIWTENMTTYMLITSVVMFNYLIYVH